MKRRTGAKHRSEMKPPSGAIRPGTPGPRLRRE
jgi:hypothetical protein